MRGIRLIIAGLDFSECSRVALGQAVRLAAATGAELRVVHVLERSLIEQVGSALGEGNEAVEARAVEKARAAVERIVAEDAAGVAATVEVRTGAAAGELTRRADEAKADLLVLGAVGDTHAGRGVGTTAGRCVRHGSTDVLLVRAGMTGRFRRILACLDFSDTSMRALRQAVEFARMEGGEVEAVHVFTPAPPYPPPVDPIGIWPVPPPDYVEVAARVREAAGEGLERAIGSLGEDAKGVAVRPTLVEDVSYSRGIVEHATTANADLVVIGTLGTSNLRYLLLGSTAERVLRHTGCSVLAVRPADGRP